MPTIDEIFAQQPMPQRGQIDYEQLLAPMFQEIANQPAPTPQEVPHAPGALQSFAAQFGANMASENSGNPFYQHQTAGLLEEGRHRSQDAEAANYELGSKFNEKKYAALANTRMKLIELKMDDAIKQGDLDLAHKLSDRAAKIQETLKREEEARAEKSKGEGRAQEHKYRMEEIAAKPQPSADEKKQANDDKAMTSFLDQEQKYLTIVNKLPGMAQVEKTGFLGMGGQTEQLTPQAIQALMNWYSSANKSTDNETIKKLTFEKHKALRDLYDKFLKKGAKGQPNEVK